MCVGVCARKGDRLLSYEDLVVRVVMRGSLGGC